MPIYEFACRKCGGNFENFVLSCKDMRDVRCPHCGSEKVHKILSGFNRGVSSGFGNDVTRGATCGTSRFR